ncbi:nitrilase-related carbon-nitrogen hydrolase [Mycolicibacterium fortuitum]|uniref:Carbon-nitrogen hydrolase n=1 Tax=Mycolicibacterium fortuitum subsp. fortuitum DSM 46621 = ATCC 6841 = JCM 6387 TaxID=1214102 RepID=K0V2N0_MYCFO|nr:nitrilase-related carbon-nitrogen hydrolase [Mycolicibacterium fortuitum]AIY44518.1 N-carbamoylputrescine amidase [Mycobacterium sp. VKM Ac-1817D]EJZ13587.1 carbon-nitrogen hydrolase [Mycolicibacterium fortuitum subsp. fortuitum DSM 46621 = ATCC 6841 = JCM 6387]WEV33191.1 hydrolase [Mycolicibacterium fortuitum]BDD96262.1 hydrolase [Mycolicibacterium fortuitum subsp. fortuitum]
MITLTASAPDSLSRSTASQRPPLRVGLVQHRWRPDVDKLTKVLRDGIDRAAGAGATAVFLPEITLLRYPADTPAGRNPGDAAEDLTDGPTFALAAEAAQANGIFVHASLYEKAPAADGLGYNTAILVSPSGELVGRTRKMHIPISAGYYEDTYFRPGPADDDPYPVYDPEGLGARIGLPTCWDEWFPEVARNYSLGGAEMVVYPTAIGSEPVFPAFDTQPLWQQVIVANGISSGLFMVVPNRTGDEGTVSFYGSSFISDPYGRVLVQAPRDEEAVLVADLDLDQRRDWLELFPFLVTRRPDSYGRLTAPVDPAHPYGDGHEATPVVK